MATTEILRLPPFGLGNSQHSYSAGRPASALRAVEREMLKSATNSHYIRRIQRLETLIEQTKELSNLKEHWDSYGATPPNDWAIGAALRFLISGVAMDIQPAKVLPSAEGGIALRFVLEKKRALVEFLNSKSVDVMLYDEAGTLDSEVEETEDEGRILHVVKAHLTR